jgi:ABC-type uncharacterized transport system permease subunit
VAARILKMGWEDNFMFLLKMGCDVGYWMQVAEDHVHWKALVLVMLILNTNALGDFGTVTDVTSNIHWSCI